VDLVKKGLVSLGFPYDNEMNASSPRENFALFPLTSSVSQARALMGLRVGLLPPSFRRNSQIVGCAKDDFPGIRSFWK
jgi:hypothetical protein